MKKDTPKAKKTYRSATYYLVIPVEEYRIFPTTPPSLKPFR